MLNLCNIRASIDLRMHTPEKQKKTKDLAGIITSTLKEKRPRRNN
jgi:hypothetical protein